MDSIFSFFSEKYSPAVWFLHFVSCQTFQIICPERKEKQIKIHKQANKQTNYSKENFFPLDLGKYFWATCTLKLFSEISAGISTGKF